MQKKNSEKKKLLWREKMNSDTPATVVQYTKKVKEKSKAFLGVGMIHESEFQCV